MGEPSPYVSIYMSRKQAEAALKSLRWDVEGRAKSNPLWVVVKRFEQALTENDGEPG
jgi:hypothetical protein